MADIENQAKKPGLLKRLWRFIARPSVSLSVGFLTFCGIVIGVLFWGGFHWALEMTNTEPFCISCHEMRDNVFAEYQGTVHQNNSSGVRATCPDCHVPKEWGPKLARKIAATKELYGHFVTRSIWTEEKFKDQRIHLASNEWARMKKTDSQECRNCHAFDYMDFTQQENRAAKNHQKALDDGLTCIDCHQGIAHDLPPNYLEAYRGVVADLIANGDIEPQQRDIEEAKAAIKE
ncbi:MAG: NapC/NirT family cytochrome c [Pseudomonadota bacterium]